MLQWSALFVRRSLPFALIVLAWLTLAPAAPLWAQEAPENASTTGIIQGKVVDEDGLPVEGAKISYSSQSGDTRGATRADAL